MDVIKTAIEGVVIIEPCIFEDARGYFFESFSHREFSQKKGESDYSVSRLVPMTGIIPLLAITKEMLDINRDFVNTMIDICNELSNNPPFPRWKDGLDELWN